jgi:Recombination directionality factor-like
MGILGLTHDENGAALEKLPVTIKVAIGEGPEPGNANGHPRKLDHFVFKRKTLHGQDVVWEPALDIAQAHGEKPTELGIIFLNDDPREVFRTEYALWIPSGCKCHGELAQIANGEGVRLEMQATRRTQKHPEGEPWPGNYKYVEGPKKGETVEPCGDGCPDLERGDCRPSGDLYFILEKFPIFGAICRLHTSSYRSVRNLSNSLMQIRRLNGGRLTGIKAILKASPERISYSDRDGTRHTSVAYILSLEIGAMDLRSLVANMREPIRLLGEGHSAVDLSRGVQFVVRETDAERAKEIAGEFYPSGEAPTAEAVESAIGQSERDEQLARICEVARRLGYNDAKTKMLLGQSAGNLARLERKLLNELDEQPARMAAGNGDRGHQRPQRKEASPANGTATSNVERPVMRDGPSPGDEGFLF